MTTEQKAKAYDEAIDKVAHFIKKHIGLGCTIHPNSSEAKELFNIFPELRESEDERIRNEILIYLGSKQDITLEQHNAWLAWIEKQGQKPINDTDEDIVKAVKDTSILDMVEPKFHEGNWIVFNGFTFYVKEVVKGFYRTITRDDTPYSYAWDIDNVARLWTIQDAKDGDVLVDEDNNIGLYLEEKDDLYWHSYIYLGCDGYLRGGVGYHKHKNTKPATKEQRDLLFSKMKEACYEWDAENKELKRVVDEEQIKKNLQDNSFRRMFEQNPDWSEEDDQYLLVCKNALAKYQVSDKWDATIISRWLEDKLKSLRPQPKNKWSEEDETALGDALWCCKQAASIAKDENDMGNAWYAEHWLKSLKDRVQPQPK